MEPDASLSTVKRHFILQQGLPEPAPASCSTQYSALLFQPRLVGLVLLAAIVLQDPRIFLCLAVVLWWSALFPRLNPFEALYNRTLALRPGRVPLGEAPGPRRFAQGMAGTFALAIGFALMSGWKAIALLLEGLLVVAVGALVFGGFCLGSFVFHVLNGRATFAKRTLPWARGA